jgi:hypothetical protein
MKSYVHKPTVVLAVRFFTGMNPYPPGVVSGDPAEVNRSKIKGQTIHLVETTHGPVRVNGGDWIVYGDDGKMWPVDDDTFSKSYQPVVENVVSDPGAQDGRKHDS